MTELVFDDDGALLVNPGLVGRVDSVSHTAGGVYRGCIHLRTEQPPALVVLSRDALARLNFQPVIRYPPSPCIAARMGDILTIGFDQKSSKYVNSNDHRKTPPWRWSYRLHPCRWDGQDQADLYVVAAVRISDQPNGTP